MVTSFHPTLESDCWVSTFSGEPHLSQILWIPALILLRYAKGVHAPWRLAAPIALVIVYGVG